MAVIYDRSAETDPFERWFHDGIYGGWFHLSGPRCSAVAPTGETCAARSGHVTSRLVACDRGHAHHVAFAGPPPHPAADALVSIVWAD